VLKVLQNSLPLTERAQFIAEWEQSLKRQKEVLGLAPDGRGVGAYVRKE
jgi:hypothetical protein